MSRGRPRDRAPDGFLTVSQAAETLGISQQAVRARLDRGTLPGRTDVLDNGEVRRYVPRNALDDAIRDKHLPMSRDDAAEIHLTGALLAKEIQDTIIQESRRHEAAVTEVMRESIQLLHNMSKSEEAYQERVLSIIEEDTKQRRQNRKDVQHWRMLAYVALIFLIAIFILALGEHLSLW